jgi:excisionase family DNA binding protein
MSKLLSRKEVAQRLSVSVDTIKRWEKNGQIAAIKLPGAVRFREEWLENWLNKRTIKAKS